MSVSPRALINMFRRRHQASASAGCTLSHSFPGPRRACAPNITQPSVLGWRHSATQAAAMAASDRCCRTSTAPRSTWATRQPAWARWTSLRQASFSYLVSGLVDGVILPKQTVDVVPRTFGTVSLQGEQFFA